MPITRLDLPGATGTRTPIRRWDRRRRPLHPVALRPWLLASAALTLCSMSAPNRLHAQAPERSIDPDVLRRMSIEELMDMDVTSVSRAPEPYARAPAAIQVITGQQIRRSGATTLPDALRLATSLHVAKKNAHSWAISARGFNTDLANKLLVLIDGRTVYTPLFSGVFWDRQDYLLEDIDRVEVISGPGGALWGANAVNGVINVITKTASQTQGLYAEGATGTRLGGLVGARYGGRAGSRFNYRIYGRYLDRDNERFPDGSEAFDSWHRRQIGFRADVDAGVKDLLTVQGDLYDGDLNMSTGGAGAATGGNVLGRWTRTLSGGSDVSVQIYYDATSLTTPTPALVVEGIEAAPAGTLADELDTYDVDFQHYFRVGAGHRVVWGGGYRYTRDKVANAPGLAFLPEMLDRTLYSAFVQDEVLVGRSLSLTLGSKVEHNEYTGFEFEPNARLAYSVGASRALWAAVSRAVRMPSRVDRHERLRTPGFAPLVENLLVGSEDFTSETVVAYEIGYRARLGADLVTSVSAFYNRYDDLRSTSLSPPDPTTQLPFPLFFANNLQATSHGVELVTEAALLPTWSLRAGYTLLCEKVVVREGQMDFNNALNETADPRHQASLQSSVDLPFSGELEILARWIGSFEYNDAGSAEMVPSYLEAGARLAWHPTPFAEVSLVGNHLVHDRHLEYVISGPNLREEISRSVHLKVAFRW